VKPGSDGVIRQEWIVDDHPIPHAPTTPTRAAATVVTPAPIDRAPPVASVAGRVGEWNDRLQAIVDDESTGRSPFSNGRPAKPPARPPPRSPPYA
jgi:hypothetical protein